MNYANALHNFENARKACASAEPPRKPEMLPILLMIQGLEDLTSAMQKDSKRVDRLEELLQNIKASVEDSESGS